MWCGRQAQMSVAYIREKIITPNKKKKRTWYTGISESGSGLQLPYA